MEAYKNQDGTILIDDPKSQEIKVWRNFWGSFRVYLGLSLVAIIVSLALSSGMGLVGEKIEFFQKERQQPETPEELLTLSDTLFLLGSLVGTVASPFIINSYLKSRAKKRWLDKYENNRTRTV